MKGTDKQETSAPPSGRYVAPRPDGDPGAAWAYDRLVEMLGSDEARRAEHKPSFRATLVSLRRVFGDIPYAQAIWPAPGGYYFELAGKNVYADALPSPMYADDQVSLRFHGRNGPVEVVALAPECLDELECEVFRLVRPENSFPDAVAMARAAVLEA